jgi:hypothetical protein
MSLLGVAGFAEDRPVIIFDNTGVASSSGETPDTVEAMTDHVAAFVGSHKPRTQVLIEE